MESAVESVIRKVERGVYFDSHFVIDTIIRDHSDAYLTFAAERIPRDMVTEYVHSEIAKIISAYNGSLVERVEGAESMSYNIRGNASTCALWIRR